MGEFMGEFIQLLSEAAQGRQGAAVLKTTEEDIRINSLKN